MIVLHKRSKWRQLDALLSFLADETLMVIETSGKQEPG